MSKRLTLLTIVFTLHSIVKSDPEDLLYQQEDCFLENCQSTFNIGVQYPICGTDNNPYRNWIQLDCANLCARKYFWEIHGNFKGLCPGKAPAEDYWRMRMVMRDYYADCVKE